MSSLSAFPTVVETSLHPVSSKVAGATVVQFDFDNSEFSTPKKSPIINLAAAPADPGLATGLQRMKIHYCKSDIKLWEDLIADPT